MKTLAETVEDLRQLTKGRIDHDKQMAKFAERAKKLVADTTQLATDLAAFINGNANGVLKEAAASKPKVERKVKALAIDFIRTLESLESATEAMTIKNIAELTRLGPRIVGAALRQLVAEGKAVQGPRGKYKAVEQESHVEANQHDA